MNVRVRFFFTMAVNMFGFFYHGDQHVRCFTAYLYFYYIRQCEHHSEIINNKYEI